MATIVICSQAGRQIKNNSQQIVDIALYFYTYAGIIYFYVCLLKNSL